MKKSMALLTLLLVTGCSSTADTTNHGRIKTTPAPAVAETAPPSKPAIDIESEKSKYGGAMSAELKEFAISMFQFSQLNTQASENSQLFSDSKWKQDLHDNLTVMQMNITTVKSLTPPPSVKTAHSLVLNAMNEFQFVVDNYYHAIEVLDTELMQQCLNHMNQGAIFMEQANKEMAAIL
ncbi:hypothetical protein [Peribacillus kribbensis]|uniref:hypothetical protein n=1 Tax=Peribacillus kribbensis TaxID=356658 RepID=UPI00047B7ABC|nr:hypothetical protein [Peribacillus kribbensis]